MNVLAPVRRDRVVADLPQVSGEGTAPGGGRPPRPTASLGPLCFPPPHPPKHTWQCFRKEAALHTRPEFHSSVTSACQEQRTGTVG